MATSTDQVLSKATADHLAPAGSLCMRKHSSRS